MYHNLYSDTILVSDSHYNHTRDEFLQLLIDIDNQTIKTNQLILVGDMFDLLVGTVDYTILYNNQLVKLLQNISTKIEVIYLEGNHDFCLSKLFTNIKVYDIQHQPIYCKYKDKKIAISHGDFATSDMIYTTYLKIIRNPTMLKILNLIDKKINNYISKKIIFNQINKTKCKDNIKFDDIARFRLSHYKDADIVIEGHYHQNKSYTQNDKLYINLPAFVCTKEYKRIDSIL